ncbi:6620_t:CDS:2, partial [Entrophospora sp. SA101]
PILVNINEQRCTKASDCSTISNSPLCVLPYMPAGFPRPLRIYYRDSPWINQNNDQENVLLYMGDLQVVWEIVQVGILQSRWSWVPLWIPMSTELIMRYTVSFSLALCVLNILPAIQLDGHYALTAILYWLFNINKDNDDRDDLSFYITSTSTDSKRKLLRIENLIDGGGAIYDNTNILISKKKAIDENVRRIYIYGAENSKVLPTKFLLKLIQQCWNANPENRPDSSYIGAELAFGKPERLNLIKPENSNQQTKISLRSHEKAIYTSRFMNFKNLPEPTNAIIY